jgi:hypothetical protein
VTVSYPSGSPVSGTNAIKGCSAPNGSTITYITDPWGTRIEIIERAQFGPEGELAVTSASGACAAARGPRAVRATRPPPGPEPVRNALTAASARSCPCLERRMIAIIRRA